MVGYPCHVFMRMTTKQKLDEMFKRLEKECIEKGIDEKRIRLLRLIKIEAECGLPFADNLKNSFPEVIT